jgi:superoxide dismutase
MVQQRHWMTTSSPSGNSPKVTQTKAKRSRHRFSRIDNVPSYRDFMHRQAVVSLYRQFMKTIRSLPDKSELQSQIRKEFSSMKHEKDEWNKKRAIQEGQRRLKDLQVAVSTSVTSFAAPAQRNTQEEEDTKVVGTGWPWERNN